MSTFTWVPDKGLKGNTKPAVSAIEFGDGYGQRVAFGINTIKPTRSLQFTLLSETVFNEIIAFLETHRGVDAFDWTPPGGVVGRYICEEWDDDTDAITFSVSMKFKRVFGV